MSFDFFFGKIIIIIGDCTSNLCLVRDWFEWVLDRFLYRFPYIILRFCRHFRFCDIISMILSFNQSFVYFWKNKINNLRYFRWIRCNRYFRWNRHFRWIRYFHWNRYYRQFRWTRRFFQFPWQILYLEKIRHGFYYKIIISNLTMFTNIPIFFKKSSPPHRSTPLEMLST